MFDKNFEFGSKFLLFDPHRSAKQEVFRRGDTPWKENTDRFWQLGSKDLKVERESARRLTYKGSGIRLVAYKFMIAREHIKERPLRIQPVIRVADKLFEKSTQVNGSISGHPQLL
jgi:hypothetical protein